MEDADLWAAIEAQRAAAAAETTPDTGYPDLRTAEREIDQLIALGALLRVRATS